MDQKVPKLQVGLRCDYPNGDWFIVTGVNTARYTINHSVYGESSFPIASFDTAAEFDSMGGGVYNSKQATLAFIKRIYEDRG